MQYRYLPIQKRLLCVLATAVREECPTDRRIYEALIHEATRSRNIHQAKHVHSHIISHGRDRDRFLINLIVQMYGACGCVEEASSVFSKIEKPNFFSIKIMIAAYAQNGQMQQARELFERADFVDTSSWNHMIRGYTQMGFLQEARELLERMPEKSTVGTNAMVTAYAQSGHLQEMEFLFGNMSNRDTVSWTGILIGYIQNGRLERARETFRKMTSWDIVSWNIMITANAQYGDIQTAEALFNEMPQRSIISWNALVQAYSMNVCVSHARNLFNMMPERDVVSWTGMLTGYVQNGDSQEAMDLFYTMPVRNMVSWNAIIHGCLQIYNVEYARIFLEKMPQSSVLAWNSTITAYAHSGHPDLARSLFESMRYRNAFSWCALIIAYVQAGCIEDAVVFFEHAPYHDAVSCNEMIKGYTQEGMVRESREVFDGTVFKDLCTYTSMVCAYSRAGDVGLSKSVFDCMPQWDAVSLNSMVQGYAQNDGSSLRDAMRMFSSIPEPDVAACNAMIYAFARNGMVGHARDLFEKIRTRNVVTWTGMVAAYAQAGRIEDAEGTFGACPRRDVILWTSLIAAYALNGDIEKAQTSVRLIPQRDTAVWNALVTGYIQSGHPGLAIKVFATMDLECVRGNEITYVGVLDACGNASAIRTAEEVRESIVENGLDRSARVGNALVSMYGRFCRMEKAWEIFRTIRKQDLVAWNAMIAANAQNGHNKETLELFREMKLAGIQPDGITFVSVLSACSHGGMLKDGRDCFLELQTDCGTPATVDHYICMVDGLGRASMVKQAEELIQYMPFEPDSVAWATLLGACTSNSSAAVGARAGERVMQLDPCNGAGYILLSNIHSVYVCIVRMEQSRRRLGTVARHLEYLAPVSKSLVFNKTIRDASEEGMPVIIGAMVTDIQSSPATQLKRGTTILGQVKYNFGGVARNIAECMVKLGVAPFLISVVGDDMAGNALVAHWESLGLSVNGIRRCSGDATPVISVVFDNTGEIAAGVADTDAVEKQLTPEWINQFTHIIQTAPILLLDANLIPASLEAACKLAKQANVPVWFEPVSVQKSVRATGLYKYITYVSPNEEEVTAMGKAISPSFKDIKECITLLLNAGVKHVIVTLGSKGLITCTLNPSRKTGISCIHIPALAANVVNVSGAGDCLVAGSIYKLAAGNDLCTSLAFGTAIAKQAVRSSSNVPHNFCRHPISEDAESTQNLMTTIEFDKFTL